MNDSYELIVVGGGPAGLAAAIAAWEKGLRRILVIERDRELGGILNQCIHNGFGLHYFKTELTGPEYALRFVQKLEGTGIETALDTMVLEISSRREVHILNREGGYRILRADAVVLAMGCRERTRGAIAIPGSRPAGIMTAGAAQRYVNMEGYLPGRRVVILGSGDIGLIMARRMTLEGAKVLACIELMPYSGGLMRNIVQCLEDYDIPLYLSHTIVDIQGRERVEKVTMAQVDENRSPIPGTEVEFDCDTVLLSVGLIPENELSRQAGVKMDSRTGGAVVYENMETSLPGVFACGNAVHVHDLVDFVTEESIRAGEAAAGFVQSRQKGNTTFVLAINNGDGVSYTVPQQVRMDDLPERLEVFFRVNRIYKDSRVLLRSGEQTIAQFRREHMAPGEMERVTVPKTLMARIEGQSCELTVEEVAQ